MVPRFAERARETTKPCASQRGEAATKVGQCVSPVGPLHSHHDRQPVVARNGWTSIFQTTTSGLIQEFGVAARQIGPSILSRAARQRF